MIIIKAGYFLGGKGEGLCTFLNGCNHSPLDYTHKKSQISQFWRIWSGILPSCLLPMPFPFSQNSVACQSTCLIVLFLPNALALSVWLFPLLLFFKQSDCRLCYCLEYFLFGIHGGMVETESVQIESNKDGSSVAVQGGFGFGLPIPSSWRCVLYTATNQQ